jgi:hypothetical protein
MSESRPIRIVLTPEQKRAIADQTGLQVSEIEFTAEELEQRIAPVRPTPGGPIPIPYPN